jgi:hypothetical protein
MESAILNLVIRLIQELADEIRNGLAYMLGTPATPKRNGAIKNCISKIEPGNRQKGCSQ